jgi:hypothetical protein
MKKDSDFQGITVRKGGVVCIHRMTLEAHGLSGIEFVDLEYDPKESVLTIKPTETVPSTLAVSKEPGGTIAIRGRPFMLKNGISHEEESKRYAVEWDEAEKALKVKIG